MNDRSASHSKRSGKRASGRPDQRDKPRRQSEEDLQPKDPGEMPLEPQNPVKPPDPAS